MGLLGQGVWRPTRKENNRTNAAGLHAAGLVFFDLEEITCRKQIDIGAKIINLKKLDKLGKYADYRKKARQGS
jgi:hypothetical protein